MPYFTKLFRLDTNFFSTNVFSKLFTNIFSNTSKIYRCLYLRLSLTYISLTYYLACLFSYPILYPYIYIPSLYFLSIFYFTFYVILYPYFLHYNLFLYVYIFTLFLFSIPIFYRSYFFFYRSSL